MTISQPKIGFVSLGCPKALVDSERILTQLRAEGYVTVPTYQEADLVVVNTCGFIDAAVDESLETIGDALAENGRVIVTGCLGARRELIQERHPHVLAVTGPHRYEEVINAVHTHLPQKHDPFMHLVPPEGIKLTPRHYAYLKISEGCNHRCSFCIIPSMRGNLVSRPLPDILHEAERLVVAGVQELLVISQDTSAYGVDLHYASTQWHDNPVKTNCYELVKALGELGVWVRLHYVYPYPHVDQLIELMADGSILPYIDVPLQHANPRILKLMKRPAAVENNLKRIEAWRNICPDLTIRSTFIVGFPGETEAEFQELLDFMEQARLDRVGCFKYSPVEGAAANQLPDAVAEEIKQERYERFMELQSDISYSRLQEKINSEIEVIIDELDDEQVIARSYADAPEIDGKVYLPPTSGIAVGDILTVIVDDNDEYDLWARYA